MPFNRAELKIYIRQLSQGPDDNTQTLLGCTTGIRFPVVKLLDYAQR
jgi:hypothetical protein